VRSVKEECLSKVILFGERSLRRALSEYVEHYRSVHWLDALTPPLDQHLQRLVSSVNGFIRLE
jgi:hypothetical protein